MSDTFSGEENDADRFSGGNQMMLSGIIIAFVIVWAGWRSHGLTKLAVAPISLLRSMAGMVVSLRPLLNPRSLLEAALIMFVVTSLSLVLDRRGVSDQIGTYTFYLLIIGILLTLWRFIKDGSGDG